MLQYLANSSALLAWFFCFLSSALWVNDSVAEVGSDAVKATFLVNIQSIDAEASWNTASDLTGNLRPNIISELSFEDLNVMPLAVSGELEFDIAKVRALLGFEIAGGDAGDGTTIDSDYLGDDRTDEYSRSRSDIVGDDYLDYEAYIGWVLIVDDSYFTLMGGYQYNEQTFRMQNGRQLVCSSPCSGELGAFSGLDSRYKMQWQGAWLGFNWSETKGRHQVVAHYKYYFDGQYKGEAEWNLRDDLQQPLSFAHAADATGNEFRLTYHYHLSSKWQLTGLYQHSEWTSDIGTETRYFSNSNVGSTRLNGAQWKADTFALGIQYAF